jgi:hypothetical protein
MHSTTKLFFLLTTLAFTGTASASTMLVTCSTLNGPTELSGNLVCPQFSGLNLQGISITLNGGINGSITLTNNASVIETGSGTTTSQFTVGPLTGFSILAPLFSSMFTTGSQSLTAGQTKTFSGLSGTGTATITDTSLFAPYTGAGNFNIPVSTSTMLNITGGGGNFAGGQSTTANATASVTYTFGTSSAPEIGTPLYLATGLGAILIGLWRRRSTRRGKVA